MTRTNTPPQLGHIDDDELARLAVTWGAQALRGDPATASARLIALTGYGQEEDRRRAREAGFDEHLTKPADPVMLLALLREARPG